jgi:hypothetical protein
VSLWNISVLLLTDEIRPHDDHVNGFVGQENVTERESDGNVEFFSLLFQHNVHHRDQLFLKWHVFFGKQCRVFFVEICRGGFLRRDNFVLPQHVARRSFFCSLVQETDDAQTSHVVDHVAEFICKRKLTLYLQKFRAATKISINLEFEAELAFDCQISKNDANFRSNIRTLVLSL